MNRERLKSTILFLLVISSAILTYMVWSYQPEFSQVDTSIESTSNIGQGESLEFGSVMRAYQLIWVDGNSVKGTIKEDAVVGVREFLKDTEIENIDIYNNMNRLTPDVKEDGGEEFLIVDYPSEMPSKSLFQVLGFSYEGALPDYSFDRIIVDIASPKVTFYMLNEALEQVAVAETDIDSSYLLSIVEEYEDSFEDYVGIITNQKTSNNKTAIYGPEAPGAVSIEHFLMTQIGIDTMNDILFMGDEIEVNKNDDVYVYEGTHNLSTYNPNTYNFVYTNLDESLSSNRNSHQTIQRSFDFLNSHGGLENEHMLFDYEADGNESTYRYTLNGYAVFSDEISSVVTTKYGNNALFEYQRPLLNISAEVPNDEMKSLARLEDVRYQIALNEDLDLQKVSKITIGYDMQFSDVQTELNLLHFTPQWYVKYNDEWMRFNEGGLH
ncbi:two-component system activity regulator YycH [Salinicoccus jeotgali]|uniref:Two-component system activity regulator YycH n=1 Tax=Salinicoccus jeotgali TaxID=381634 RepID=A0ABP7EPV9_9STAP